MEFSAQQIAEMIQGIVEGSVEQKIDTISGIKEAQSGSLTFLSNMDYLSYIYTTRASIAIVGNDFVAEQKISNDLTLIRVENPYMALATLLKAYDSFLKPKPGISKLADISASAVIGKNVHIAAFVHIGDNVKIDDGVIVLSNTSIHSGSKIGSDTVIHSNCSIYRDTSIGRSCILHSGVVVGADGFGFAPQTDGFQKVAQIGNVIIEENVEIGANTCIDRATLGSTLIRKNVKLDNLIQVAHNVEIGENTVVASHVGIAGSTKIGKNCMVGGQVGFNGHITVADGTKIAGQAGVTRSVKKENTTIQGTPAIADREHKRSYLHVMKLPELRHKVDELMKEIESLKNSKG